MRFQWSSLSLVQTVSQNGGKPGCERRPDGNCDQDDHITSNIGNGILEDINDGHAIDFVAGVQAHADRRSDQSDRETSNHHSAELKCAEAIRIHHREQDRGQQQDRRRDVDKCADEQNQDDENKCNCKSRHIQSEEEGSNQLRNALHGQDPGEDGREADDDHNGRTGDETLLQGFPYLLPGEFPVNEETYNQRIEYRNTCTLGSGADSAGYTDDDKQRQQDGREPAENTLLCELPRLLTLVSES